MMLTAKNFGIAAAIVWGVSVFLMTWLALGTGYGKEFLSIIRDMYPGFEISPLGSLIGLLYGLVDGFLGGFIFAWIYNKLNR
jgi:hypothetical protein